MSLHEKMNNAKYDGSWTRPERYKLDGTDNDRFEDLLDRESLLVHDPIAEISDDLFELRHPGDMEDSKLRAEFVKQFVDSGTEYGEWVHFPWSRTVVRYPEQDDHYRLRTFRNQHLITQAEQDTLHNTTIAAFGMSVGSNIIDQIIPSGIGGGEDEVVAIADFDRLAPSNLNRIRSHMGRVGVRKIDIVAQKISEVDPYIEQVHLHDGYDELTTPNILDQHQPDIIIEEVDDIVAKARVRQYASERGIPLVMAADLHETSLLHVERHDLHDVKPFNGRISRDMFNALLADELPKDEYLKANIKILGARNALSSARFIDSNMDIGKNLAGIPQLGAIATAGAALTDRAIREILLGRKLDSGIYKESAGNTLRTERISTRREHAVSIGRLLRSMKS